MSSEQGYFKFTLRHPKCPSHLANGQPTKEGGGGQGPVDPLKKTKRAAFQATLFSEILD